nr:MAG TPA: hypothetical protein [Caudoviricetes sp.]
MLLIPCPLPFGRSRLFVIYNLQPLFISCLLRAAKTIFLIERHAQNASSVKVASTLSPA